MKRYQDWSPYGGSSAIILAVALLLVVGVLLYMAWRLSQPKEVQRPGKFLGVTLVVMWVLSVGMFVIAATVYVRVLYQQVGRFTGPVNHITPVTMASAVVAFFVILVLTGQRSGFWTAIVSAIVGTIAAPLIFELPFDLIVMWRTYPPNPASTFTLLFFLPLFLVEIASFAMLALSPCVRLSRATLLLLAGMFGIFAVWALFGFAYPATAFPIAMNMISKVLAFAAAVSLFLPTKKVKVQETDVEPVAALHA